MRRSRTVSLIITSVAAVTGAVVLIAVPSHAAVGDRYVALGDSYASGVGAGSYIASSGSCDRSTNAYPSLWAKAHAPVAFTFAACGGATTGSVASGQLSTLSTSTTLVSISVGGNDVGFSGVMKTCALHGTEACVTAVQQGENAVRSTLPGALDSLFSAIRSRAPSARVVVLDYPVFYQLNTLCIGLSATSHAKIDEGVNLLDGVLSSAASRHNFRFADVRSAFVGHQLCSGHDWLHSVDLRNIGNSYHPTATGHSNGYLPAFTSAAS